MWSEATEGVGERHPCGAPAVPLLWQEPAGQSFPLPQAHFLLCKTPIVQCVCVCVSHALVLLREVTFPLPLGPAP